MNQNGENKKMKKEIYVSKKLMHINIKKENDDKKMIKRKMIIKMIKTIIIIMMTNL